MATKLPPPRTLATVVRALKDIEAYCLEQAELALAQHSLNDASVCQAAARRCQKTVEVVERIHKFHT